MVWGCFAGDNVCDLFRIQGTLNQHGYDCSDTPSQLLCAWDYHLFFNRTMTKHTSTLCKGLLYQEEECWSAVSVTIIKC